MFREMNVELPVKMKVCFKEMEECILDCLGVLLQREAKPSGLVNDVKLCENY